MKRKTIIFVTLLTGFLMLMMPNISAVKQKINDPSIKKIEKTEIEFKNIKNDDNLIKTDLLSIYKLLLILLDWAFLLKFAHQFLGLLFAQQSLFDWIKDDSNPTA